MFITAGRPCPTPRHGMRRAPAYLAESIRVLAAEYSSTLRKVQPKTPHAALPPPATKGPEKGTASRRMETPPAPPFVLILSSSHWERRARHQTTTSGRQTASGGKRFGRQGREQRGVPARTSPLSRPAAPRDCLPAGRDKSGTVSGGGKPQKTAISSAFFWSSSASQDKK